MFQKSGLPHQEQMAEATHALIKVIDLCVHPSGVPANMIPA